MKLSLQGIVFLGTAWGLVMALAAYCFYKVIWGKPSRKEPE